jgi:hypothetical protein
VGKIIGDIWPYTFWVYCFILSIGEVFVEFIITSGLMVNGDGQLLRVVLESLLGNAWKFTGEQPQAAFEFDCTRNNGNPNFYGQDWPQCSGSSIVTMVAFGPSGRWIKELTSALP